MEDDPGTSGYVWRKAGPTLTIEHQGAVLPVTIEQLLAAFDMQTAWSEMLRQDAIRRRAMRRLKVADPDGYARLQYLLRLGEAARQDREDREREARRCPCCGCDPEAHGDWDD